MCGSQAILAMSIFPYVGTPSGPSGLYSADPGSAMDALVKDFGLLVRGLSNHSLVGAIVLGSEDDALSGWVGPDDPKLRILSDALSSAR